MTRSMPIGQWWCSTCRTWTTPDHVFVEHALCSGFVDCLSCGELRGVERRRTPDGWMTGPCASCGVVLGV